MKKIILLKTGTIDRNTRLPKVIHALKDRHNITLLSWDFLCENSKAVKSTECNIIEFKLKAPKGIKIIFFLPFWWAFSLFYLLNSKFDVVHAIDIDSVVPAIIAGKIKKKPIIYEILDICEYELIMPSFILNLVVKLDKIFMALADAIIVVDEMQIVGLDGIPNNNIFIIYDSPPSSLLVHNEAGGKVNNEFILFYVGMFFKSKKLHLENVVEAVKDLDNVRLIIAGYGDMMEDIVCWSKQLPDKIMYIGRISYKDVFEKGKSSDLMFVLRDPSIPANKYTCGSNMFNAMMLGKPILANEGTSTAIKVNNANCGLVINSNDVDEIKKAILKLRDNPKLNHDFGANAKRAYDQQYSWELMGMRLIKVYADLLKKD